MQAAACDLDNTLGHRILSRFRFPATEKHPLPAKPLQSSQSHLSSHVLIV